ncbi:ParA family protein [Crateriforma conspicua]|uniref:ParA family protein n=1 Tax=Crateriforma conspicua TaxID=2527996 RepID=UPI00118BAC7B|nr:ParA family protein [Crateriforma conspicua]QDV66079.1 MinD/ParA/CobQ/CobA-like protein [Crateriforma conspicua]
MSAFVLTLYARKGGVGRTLMSQNLAGACAEHGGKVLVIDLDPQASVSKNFFGRDFVSRLRPYQTTAALFDESRDPEYSEIIHKTKVDEIDIAPSSDFLEPFDLPNPTERGEMQFAVRDLVEAVRGDFHLILIDTPPNVSNLLAWAALMASDFVVTPVQPEKNSCEGVLDVKQRLHYALRNGNSELVDLGYFINNMDARTTQHRIMEEELRQLYGSQVFDTVIYRRTEFQNTQHAHRPITHESPNSSEAGIIRDLLHEIVERVDLETQKSIARGAA